MFTVTFLGLNDHERLLAEITVRHPDFYQIDHLASDLPSELSNDWQTFRTPEGGMLRAMIDTEDVTWREFSNYYPIHGTDTIRDRLSQAGHVAALQVEEDAVSFTLDIDCSSANDLGRIFYQLNAA